MNNDLIRRGELEPVIEKMLLGVADPFDLIMAVLHAPAVDAVEVVRCEECRHCKTIFPEKRIDQEPTQVLFCEIYRCNRKPDEYCSDGDRREDDG